MNAPLPPDLSTGLQLLNDYQRGFPLLPRPYAHIGAQLGLDEAAVMAAYADGLQNGTISRIGGVVPPRRLGASTLAAMAVPAERLEEVAAFVSAQAEVNHNYERENHWNLWFVVAAADAAKRKATLNAIAQQTGLEVITLPLMAEYHIELGFDLHGDEQGNTGLPVAPASVSTSVSASTPNSSNSSNSPNFSSAPCALIGMEQDLMAALQVGLPLTSRPYATLGTNLGLSEAMVIEIIQGWLDTGLLKRFGIIVRHRHLGYTANAMCVWNVPDEQVDTFGYALATLPGITLCYQRQRAAPWPYNLYCMIHGKVREDVLALRSQWATKLGLDDFPHEILFSRHCFKQCGARYTSAP